MKSAKITTLLALASAFSLIIGCGQKEQTVPEPPAKVEKAAEAVPVEMPKAAEAPAPAVAATPEVTPAATATIDQAQSQIDKVKSLLADKKYAEALTALKELAAMKLTPDQQMMVDGLKAQVEKAMQAEATSDATKSVGGMLGK
jgi:glycerol-3-phosphate O-acyltransferase